METQKCNVITDKLGRYLQITQNKHIDCGMFCEYSYCETHALYEPNAKYLLITLSAYTKKSDKKLRAENDNINYLVKNA